MWKQASAIITAIALIGSGAWAQGLPDPNDPNVSTNEPIQHTVYIQADGTIFPPLVLYDANDTILFVNFNKRRTVTVEFFGSVGVPFTTDTIGRYGRGNVNSYSEQHALTNGYALVVDATDITYSETDPNLNTPRCFRAIGSKWTRNRSPAQRMAGIAPSGNDITNIIVPQCLINDSTYINASNN